MEQKSVYPHAVIISVNVESASEECNFGGNLFQNKALCQGIPRIWLRRSSFLLSGGDQMCTDGKTRSDATHLVSCGVLSGSELRKYIQSFVFRKRNNVAPRSYLKRRDQPQSPYNSIDSILCAMFLHSAHFCGKLSKNHVCWRGLFGSFTKSSLKKCVYFIFLL